MQQETNWRSTIPTAEPGIGEWVPFGFKQVNLGSGLANPAEQWRVAQIRRVPEGMAALVLDKLKNEQPEAMAAYMSNKAVQGGAT